jgi:hypothetical protein
LRAKISFQDLEPDMQSRNIESIVTFRQVFSIGTTLVNQPAGSYRVTKEEELIEGLSFPAYHVTASAIEVPAIGVPSATKQQVPITVGELTTALELDSKLLTGKAER